MSQAVKKTSPYLESLPAVLVETGEAPAWLVELRRRAAERFGERGFPTTDEEEWKYTNLSPLARENFGVAVGSKTGEVPADLVEPWTYEESRRSQLVFVDGRFSRELSSLESLGEGVVVEDILTTLRGAHAEEIRRWLEAEGGPLNDLNTALFAGGAFVRIERGVELALPIHLLFLSTASQSAAFTRVFVVAEENSAATIIESYASLGDGGYYTNTVAQVAVGDGARLRHYRVQAEGEDGFQTGTTKAAVGRASSYDLTSINLGARLSRHDIVVSLAHEGSEAWVDGLYLLGEGQHHDTHSLIDHLVPRCNSHQNYKGILDGRSRAVFNGRVYVHPDAQQTDAFQSNKNLLLSPDARVDTKPQLEIYADDVKCAHGTTVGQLEEEELFYLISRGLPPPLARNLLTYGFAEEIVEKIKIESIKRQLDRAILNRLHADLGD